MRPSNPFLFWRRWSSQFPSFVLAVGHVQRAWRLLLMAGIGMMAAIVLICTIPLYTQISTTAGLYNVLKTLPDSSYLTIKALGMNYSPGTVPDANAYAHMFDQDLSNFSFSDELQPALETEMPLTPDTNTAPAPITTSGKTPSCDDVAMAGYSASQLPAHTRVIQGRLPRANQDDLEIAVSPATAAASHLSIGSVLYARIEYAYPGGVEAIDTSQLPQQLALHVVGIFAAASDNDAFWHGETFDPVVVLGPPSTVVCPSLVSLGGFLATFQHLLSVSGAHGYYPSMPVTGYWYVHLDNTRITSNNLDSLIASIQNVSTNIDTVTNIYGYNEQYTMSSPLDLLQTYRDRVRVGQIPILTLAFLILGLVLFFMALMVQALIERQTAMIAVLRSRGASQRQVFWVFVVPCLLLALLALVLGPLVALNAARFLALTLIPPANWNALNVISAQPLQALWSVSGYAFAATGIAIVALQLAIFAATRSDVLALRREASRSRRRPFWQRFFLDGVAALIALTGYGYVTYTAGTGALGQLNGQLIIVPLTIATSVFFLIACAFFLLRFVPWLLRMATQFVTRGRSFASMLALAQMGRAPQQAVRIMLLLAFTTAFGIFALVFVGTQAQRVQDVADYQVGADFSGDMGATIISGLPLAQHTAMYQKLPGVTSATLGYINDATTQDGYPALLQAVDTTTFARTAIWTQQDSSQSLATLMDLLAKQHAAATKSSIVPAVVDAALWQSLDLSIGKTFTLSESSDRVQFVTVAEVQQIPTLPANTQTGAPVPVGRLLVDYQTYNDVVAQQGAGGSVPRNKFWLRTSDDPHALAKIRIILANDSELSTGAFSDRRALVSAFQNDPVYQGLLGVFACGAIAPLLLAFLGAIVVTWQNARQRLINWVVLRTLGTTPRQVASVLLWEQSIVYAVALVMGGVLGTIFSLLALPVLAFTSVASNQVGSTNFLLLQTVPPIHIAPPPSLAFAPLLLIVLCGAAVWLTLHLLSRLSLGQALRVNED